MPTKKKIHLSKKDDEDIQRLLRELLYGPSLSEQVLPLVPIDSDESEHPNGEGGKHE